MALYIVDRAIFNGVSSIDAKISAFIRGVEPKMGHRRRRCTDINRALDKWLVFVWRVIILIFINHCDLLIDTLT